ncbi:MAG: hypothetical protein ACLFWL_00780 [Candidatus Brocadiia bacterium]
MKGRKIIRNLALMGTIAVAVSLPVLGHGKKEDTGRRGRHEKYERAERRTGRHAEGTRRKCVAGGGPLGLIHHPQVEVEVKKNDDGVTLVATSDNEEIVDKLQQSIPARLENFQKLAGSRRGRAKGREIQPPTVGVEMIDDGVEITLTSKDEEQIERMHRMLSHIAKRRQGPNARHGMGIHSSLMFAKDVDVDVKNTDDGVIIDISSENPETVEKLQDRMKEQMERMEQMKERMRERRENRNKEGEGPPPWARARDRTEREKEEGEGIRRGRRTDRGRRLDPEMREIIRDEIRRYLEEKEDD